MDLRVSRPSPSTLAVPETRRGSAKREIPWVLLSRGARSSGFWVWYLKGVPVLGTNALAHLAVPTSELISAGEVNSRLDRRLESQEPIQYKQTQSYKVTLR
ncbi:hypothetical protein G9C98_007855 [Cotesia typhae]|uniref:Uncharacterized protein n=1 Tax=Cotesia typhae TaxID=2053667 RepID=A0A8J5R9D5_9HYME|nr:hypothetical protein G9C98_007855 [Cotesia typhae]